MSNNTTPRADNQTPQTPQPAAEPSDLKPHHQNDEHHHVTFADADLATDDDRDTKTHMTNASITAANINQSFAHLGQQIEIDRELLRTGDLNQEDRERVEEQLNQNVNIATAMEVYVQPSVVQNWYTPVISRPDLVSFRWGITLLDRRSLVVGLNGNIVDFDVPVIFVRAVILVLWWYMWYHVLQRQPGAPGGVVFDTVVTVVICSIVGGTLATLIALPPLLGILFWGVVWASLPGNLTLGIPKILFKISKSFGATVILIRAGMSLNVKTLGSIFLPALLLATIPVFTEAAVHCGVLGTRKNLDTMLGWMAGFALTGTSPALIVPAGYMLQAQQRGIKNGLLSMLYSASALNVAVCLLVFNILFEVEFGKSDTLMYIMIPVQIVGGVILGAVVAAIVAGVFSRILVAYRNPDGTSYYNVDRYLTIMMIGCTISMTFASDYHKVAGGGVLAVFSFSICTNYFLTKDENNVHLNDLKKNSSAEIAFLWDMLIQPFLFSLVGASQSFSKLFDPEILPDALLTFLAGSSTRCVTVFIVLLPFKAFTMKERVFSAFAWMGKATPQAALGGKVSDYVKANAAAAMFAQQGRVILGASTLGIFVIGPLSAVLMKLTGTYLVRLDEEYEKDIAPPVAVAPTEPVNPVDPTVVTIHADSSSAKPHAVAEIDNEPQQEMSEKSSGK